MDACPTETLCFLKLAADLGSPGNLTPQFLLHQRPALTGGPGGKRSPVGHRHEPEGPKNPATNRTPGGTISSASGAGAALPKPTG